MRKKPGAPTPVDRAEMNRHPESGAEILGRSRTPLLRSAAEVALTHHERWDGCGYPSRLAGEAIPLSGRIVAVVDFFDALTMDRCHRPAFDNERALPMLRNESGRAFAPRMVHTFIAYATEMIALRDRVNGERMDLNDLCDAHVSIDLL